MIFPMQYTILHLILYPEPIVMPVAALLVPALRLLLNVTAVHTRHIAEAGLLPVANIPRLNDTQV